MTRRTLTALAIVLTIAAAACGDDSSTEPPTTTAAADAGQPASTPEERFTAEISTIPGIPADRLDTFTADSLDAMQGTCTDLTSTTDAIAQDDAPNASPETDAAITGASQTMTLGAFTDEFEQDPELPLLLLDAAGQHLCPEHADTINDFVSGRRNN